MIWHAVSGSWRTVSAIVEQDVRQAVRDVLAAGDGIVTGGALGVDAIATDEALLRDPSARKLKIILPTPLTVYTRHFFNRAAEGVITEEQAHSLAAQLERVRRRNPRALTEMGFDVCNEETYYARNTAVLDESSALLAFHVNGTSGVQDMIDKALARGYPVRLERYTI